MPTGWIGKIKDFLLYAGSAFVVANVRYSLQYGRFIEFDWMMPVIVFMHYVGMALIGGIRMIATKKQLKIEIDTHKLVKQVCLFAMYVAIVIYIISVSGGYDPFEYE